MVFQRLNSKTMKNDGLIFPGAGAWKKAVILVALSFGLISCAVKTVAYRPDLTISLQPGTGISGIRVGEFENHLGLNDPKKINKTMALNREVAEVIRDALLKELSHNNIDTNSGHLAITGDIQQLDPLKTPASVARIIYRLQDLNSGQTLHEYTCESDPAARRIEPAVQNCIAQFFSTRDIALALHLKDKPSVAVTAAQPAPAPTPADTENNQDNFADKTTPDRATVRYVQQALNERGYRAGTCDGILGGGTRQALNQFQQDCGLPVSAEMDDALKYLKNPRLLADNKKPRITVERPAGSRGIGVVSAATGRKTVKGHVTDESKVTSLLINGQPAALNATGDFSTSVALQSGVNEIVIAAVDTHGNQASEILKIKKKIDTASLRPPPKSDFELGRYHALLIAVEDYDDDEISDLNYTVRDARKLKQTIEKYYTFAPGDIQLLENPGRGEIIDAFDQLSRKLTEKDNLLVFYAGHGYWDPNFEQGYWLPSDARENSRAQWLSNGTIRDFIGGIKSQHTLLIADACFGGGIFKTRKAFEPDRAVKELYKLPSRKAMTSGTMTEVPDKSVFMKYLLKRLQKNREDFLPSEGLFSSFKRAVINNSPTDQIPKFGEIHKAGDEGGDFIFVRK